MINKFKPKRVDYFKRSKDCYLIYLIDRRDFVNTDDMNYFGF